MVDNLNALLDSKTLLNTAHVSQSTGATFTVSSVYNFAYTDPIDKSVSKNQGQVITFADGSRVVFRLSGTGSQGATVRMYVERYLGPEAGDKELSKDAAEGLKELIEVALELSKLKKYLGREKPTVITVSRLWLLSHRIFVDCLSSEYLDSHYLQRKFLFGFDKNRYRPTKSTHHSS